MELFRPNDLSRRQPEFELVSDIAFSAEIQEALQSNYDEVDFSSISLSCVRGVNLVSQNFRVETNSGSFFLKWCEPNQKERLTRETNLTAGLASIGLKVPRVIDSKSGRKVCATANSCFALYVFEEGYYFCGRDSELDCAAELFGSLSFHAQNLCAGSIFRSAPVGESFVDRLPLLLSKGEARSDLLIARLIQEHRDCLVESLSLIVEQRLMLEHLVLPMHLDYHPLNLLMRNGEVACVVDFEHLRNYPALPGLGFAGYKLIRQAMVDISCRQAEFAHPTLMKRWLNGWRRSFPELDFTTEQVTLGARYHVLFLIHHILEQSINYGNNRSNYDLEKQMLSLYEIRQIAELGARAPIERILN